MSTVAEKPQAKQPTWTEPNTWPEYPLLELTRGAERAFVVAGSPSILFLATIEQARGIGHQEGSWVDAFREHFKYTTYPNWGQMFICGWRVAE